jgi:hypothetical protein
MIAGDRGGKHALLLAAGGVVGCAGILVGIPMDVFGICWIGNIWALFMFGLGLLVRGYSEPLVGIDIQAAYLPHGFMIGAGLVALAQIGYSLRRRTSGVVASSLETRTGATLLLALGVQTAVLLLMAIAAGTVVEMSPSMLVGFVLYAAVSALAAAIHRESPRCIRAGFPRSRPPSSVFWWGWPSGFRRCLSHFWSVSPRRSPPPSRTWVTT